MLLVLLLILNKLVAAEVCLAFTWGSPYKTRISFHFTEFFIELLILLVRYSNDIMV